MRKNMRQRPYYSCGRRKRNIFPKYRRKLNYKGQEMGFIDGEGCSCEHPASSDSKYIHVFLRNKSGPSIRIRLSFFSLCLICCLLVLSPLTCYGDFLRASRRQQGLRQHKFAFDSTSEPFADNHAKRELAKSLGLLHPDDESKLSKDVVSPYAPRTNPADSYSDILEKLETIVRQEDSGRDWLNITLDPSSADNPKEANAYAGGPGSSVGHSRRFSSQLPDEPLGSLSALQVLARTSGEGSETPPEESQKESVGGGPEEGRESTTQATTPSPSENQGVSDLVLHVMAKTVSDFQVIEEENALDTDSQATIFYNFPLQTMESKQIAFVVVALPPGYTARTDVPVCSSMDPEMPPLSCTTRKAYMKNRPGSLSTFITISSANYLTSLPLGRHSFRIAIHTPNESLPTDNPVDWWFSTFRFTGGHAITKHWENRKLISKRNCVWGEWRQETPCSTTCGRGFEVWTRSLYYGDSEAACGGAFMKRRCQLQECSLNCQLDEWVTMADCTKSCDATDSNAFKIRMRRVLLHKVGWGHACAELYPWDYELGMGWSEKMQAVVSISPCDKKFREPCPATLGCRVEEANTRTIPDAFPWGACPFPCGGFGTITSVVQVANGIPRWIGEKHFPQNFQIPCKADTEPLVTTRRCNMDACEDCSVYIENPIFGRATRAWFFFIPTAEADIAEVTAPRGVTIVETGPEIEQANGTKFKISFLSDVLPPASRSANDTPRVTPLTAENLLSDAEQLGTCANMATSFGAIQSCRVAPSKHYAGSQAAELILKSLIEPSIAQEGTNAGEDKKGSSRPQWFALPILLGKREEMEDAGNFYLWLTRSKFPNDPEIFKCHLRTKLPIPRRCKFFYRPKNPKDCENCKAGKNRQIETYRRFVPSVNGGTCDIPHAYQKKTEMLVKTSCLKSCSQLHQEEVTERKPGEKAPGKRRVETKMASRLERMGRGEMEVFIKGQALVRAAAKTGYKPAKMSPDFVFGAALQPIDDASMPLIGEETISAMTYPEVRVQEPLTEPPTPTMLHAALGLVNGKEAPTPLAEARRATSDQRREEKRKANIQAEPARPEEGYARQEAPPREAPQQAAPEEPPQEAAPIAAEAAPSPVAKQEAAPEEPPQEAAPIAAAEAPSPVAKQEAAPEEPPQEAAPAAAAEAPSPGATEEKEEGAPGSEKESAAATEQEQQSSPKQPAGEEQSSESSSEKQGETQAPEQKEEAKEAQENPAETEGAEAEGSAKTSEEEPKKEEAEEDQKAGSEEEGPTKSSAAETQEAKEPQQQTKGENANEGAQGESNSEETSEQKPGTESEEQEEEPEE